MGIGVSEISQILLRNRFLCTQYKLFSALPDVFNSVLKSEKSNVYLRWLSYEGIKIDFIALGML